MSDTNDNPNAYTYTIITLADGKLEFVKVLGGIALPQLPIRDCAVRTVDAATFEREAAGVELEPVAWIGVKAK